ncbi:hypothetical protein IWQ60_005808 [Tieghemiomyces parasiticus]|uniref:Uncharacterized protein n=1 Tax=Tieghemiomyces parasiticus TaxID=78921 RepID=A0A9W8AE11_9FUNG|nr:hypothetical protein IWQ60_005808 [Tieghemiomyces parasiticus]
MHTNVPAPPPPEPMDTSPIPRPPSSQESPAGNARSGNGHPQPPPSTTPPESSSAQTNPAYLPAGSPVTVPSTPRSARSSTSKPLPALTPIITSHDALRTMGHRRQDAPPDDTQTQPPGRAGSINHPPAHHYGPHSAHPRVHSLSTSQFREEGGVSRLTTHHSFPHHQHQKEQRQNHRTRPHSETRFGSSGGLNSAPAYLRPDPPPWHPSAPEPPAATEPIAPTQQQTQQPGSSSYRPPPRLHEAVLAQLPPAKESMTLRELLAAYRHDPDLLKLILPAKVEEDRLRAEDVKRQTESLRLQQLNLDIAYLELQTQYTETHGHPPPFRPSASNACGPSGDPEGQAPPYREMMDPAGRPPAHAGYLAPPPTGPEVRPPSKKRSVPHEQVMEAMRKKLHANQQSRTQTNGAIPYSPARSPK